MLRVQVQASGLKSNHPCSSSSLLKIEPSSIKQMKYAISSDKFFSTDAFMEEVVIALSDIVYDEFSWLLEKVTLYGERQTLMQALRGEQDPLKYTGLVCVATLTLVIKEETGACSRQKHNLCYERIQNGNYVEIKVHLKQQSETPCKRVQSSRTMSKEEQDFKDRLMKLYQFMHRPMWQRRAEQAEKDAKEAARLAELEWKPSKIRW